MLTPSLSVSILGITVPTQRQTLLLEEHTITRVPYTGGKSRHQQTLILRPKNASQYVLWQGIERYRVL